MKCTIFKNIYDKKPYYIPIDKALERIKNGDSRDKVEEIRRTIDRDKAQDLKKNLPSICFSGLFEERLDTKNKQHSGFVVIDFDHVQIETKMVELQNVPFFYALWVSPSGDGIKGLIRIADVSKHREHFTAFREFMPEVDKSGVNESRVCFESYDQHIYINAKSEIWNKIAIVEKIEQRTVIQDEKQIFDNLLKWQANKSGAFVSGERNTFLFKLAGACCRFGLPESSCNYFIQSNYPPTNDFNQKEIENVIKSAYKRNQFGSAEFVKDILVEKRTRKEVEVDASEIEKWKEGEPAKDVIYGTTVKANALKLFYNGYEQVLGIGIPELDELFKFKKGEITLLSGIGNYGKSTLYKWLILIRALLFGEKFAGFCPEDNPPEEYYHDFVEMLLGCDCTPSNPYKPRIQDYDFWYDWVSQHIFYLYPKDSMPTPDYIKERFLELIFKEKISGVYTDPFNTLSHNYGQHGGKIDLYLEYILGDFARFAQANNVYSCIIAHPTKEALRLNETKNFDAPDVGKISGGAMWNNKMDNVIIYHRPQRETNFSDPSCELHTKKIRRQKSVGKVGRLDFIYSFGKRRFIINDKDPLQIAIDKFLKKPSEPTVTPLQPPDPANFQPSRLPYKDEEF